MPLITVVEAYIFAALKRALAETLDDGTVVATIPELPGVIVYGADTHECVRSLYGLVEDTVRAWLSNGYRVPVLDDIDLNSDKSRILASYHQGPRAAPPEGEFYENEAALERAFEAHRKTA